MYVRHLQLIWFRMTPSINIQVYLNECIYARKLMLRWPSFCLPWLWFWQSSRNRSPLLLIVPRPCFSGCFSQPVLALHTLALRSPIKIMISWKIYIQGVLNYAIEIIFVLFTRSIGGCLTLYCGNLTCLRAKASGDDMNWNQFPIQEAFLRNVREKNPNPYSWRRSSSSLPE